MRNNVIELVVFALVLVFGAGLEELLPKVCGVGFPVLLTAVQLLAMRRTAVLAALFAVAAGAMEDSLSSLAPMTSVSYFLLITALVHWSEVPRGVTVLTYPLYQVWLALWMNGTGGNFFTRILVAFPVGLLTAFAVCAVLIWVERKAALNEPG